ncbi:MAG TPA: hypothetical protein VGH27_02405 [Streptosporangiaceae bacterium]|jgi:glutamine synthetase
MVAAAELEFFLLGPDGGPLYPEIEQYSLTKGTELELVLGTVRNDLGRVGIEVEASNPEYSGGQSEVNIRHSDALAAADQATLLRWYIGQIAAPGWTPLSWPSRGPTRPATACMSTRAPGWIVATCSPMAPAG